MNMSFEEYVAHFKGDDILCDDIINDSSRDNRLNYEFFNALPQKIQLDAIKWGYCDTVVRDNMFVDVLNEAYGVTVDEWYNYLENTPEDESIFARLKYFELIQAYKNKSKILKRE